MPPPRRVFQALIFVVVVVAFLAGRLGQRPCSHEERDAMRRGYDQALREHRARVMEAEEQHEDVTRKPYPGLFTNVCRASSPPPHPDPLPLRGRGDRNGPLSLGEGEGRGEGGTRVHA
ncbi:MAG: hypothetical protein ACREK9_11830 [Candidatus Rokuibacteriota bacterium]